MHSSSFILTGLGLGNGTKGEEAAAADEEEDDDREDDILILANL